MASSSTHMIQGLSEDEIKMLMDYRAIRSGQQPTAVGIAGVAAASAVASHSNAPAAAAASLSVVPDPGAVSSSSSSRSRSRSRSSNTSAAFRKQRAKYLLSHVMLMVVEEKKQESSTEIGASAGDADGAATGAANSASSGSASAAAAESKSIDYVATNELNTCLLQRDEVDAEDWDNLFLRLMAGITELIESKRISTTRAGDMFEMFTLHYLEYHGGGNRDVKWQLDPGWPWEDIGLNEEED